MRAELRKLVRPAVGWLLMFTVLISAAIVGLAQAADADQWTVVTEGLGALDDEEGVQRFCDAIDASGPECDAHVVEQRRDIKSLASELIREEPYAAALQETSAAPGVAAGLMASWPGLLAVALLAALHVCGEWSGGTARVIMSGRASRGRFLLNKIASVFLGSLLLFATVAAALTAITPLLRRIYDVAPLSPTFDASQYATSQSLRAILVLAFFALVAVTAAVVIRNAMAAIGVVVAFGFAMLVMGSWVDVAPWSPAYWIASTMDFDHSAMLRDHVWPTTFPMGTSTPIAFNATAGVVGLTALGLTLSVLAVAVISRREVR